MKWDLKVDTTVMSQVVFFCSALYFPWSRLFLLSQSSVRC